jgi:hypothetical protein
VGRNADEAVTFYGAAFGAKVLHIEKGLPLLKESMSSQRVDEDEYAREWERGRGLSAEEAIELALHALEPIDAF